MKHYLGLSSLGMSGAVMVMVAQPLMAAPATQVTGVTVNPTSAGVEVVLQTRDGARPQVFTVNRGNTWVADMINTQLRLSQSESFRQDNPAPGISSVVVLPLDTNSIRVIVTGQSGSPTGQISQRDRGGLVLSLTRPAGSETAQATPAPAPQSGSSGSAATPAPVPPAKTEDVLVPNPKITIDGVPVAPQSQNVAPPFLPRAVAPPVGDIVVSNVDASATEIDLGSAERVPRLVLRDAPVREVLSLLARAAGLNLAFSTESGGQQGQQGQQPAQGAQGAAGAGGPTISLDIENEPVQNVFNYVLRLSNLEANRVGQTIFVAPRLPNAARDVIVRTFRMNQVSAEQAAGFLVSMGAESAVTTTQPVTTVTAIPVQGAEGAPPITRTDTTNRTVVDTQRIDLEDSSPVLRGLQVLVDTRLNTVTLVGARKLIDVASAQLVQLDLRRRQVAVNVKIVDVNLSNTKNYGSSFSFGVDQTRVINSGGIGVINFGSTSPVSASNTGLGTVAGFSGPGAFNFARQFLLQLQASITSGNAKILTDPTLVVQEGQQGTVNLTQQVVGDVQTTITTGNNPVITTDVTKEDAGLILTVNVERIDDNGFVNLSVAPQVIALAGTQDVNLGQSGSQTIALLSERSLTSGTIRLRDGQTLILSGIIQDQDRVNARKFPILGDLPIIGALFRSTQKINQRAEVIILLTPQILDDSDASAYGYNYAPSPDVRQILERGTTKAPER